MAERFAARLESRGVVSVGGPEAVSFLQGLVSNDVEKAGSDKAVYAALLTPQGKFLFDFFIVREAEGFLLDVEQTRRADLIKRLQMYKLRAKVTIADRSGDFAIFAVWGHQSAPLVGLRSFDDPRVAALGQRAIVPVGETHEVAGRASGQLVHETEYHRHRILLGVPDGTMDLEPEQTFLLDGNFEELNGADFKKGCYVGQELTARMKHRGTARRRMLPLRGSAPLPAAGTPIVDESGREIGELRGVVGDLGMGGFRLDRLKEARQLTAGGVTLAILRPAYSVIGWETSS
jgi:folate-binding protein YgfZ